MYSGKKLEKQHNHNIILPLKEDKTLKSFKKMYS